MSPAPVRITYSPQKAAAVERSYRKFYWAIAVVAALAAGFRPQLAPFAVAWPVMLIWWQRRMDNAPRPPWVLVIGDDRLALEFGEDRRSVDRRDAEQVRFRRRHSRFATWTELQVTGRDGRPVFQVGIEDSDRPRIEAELRSRAWPLTAGR